MTTRHKQPQNLHPLQQPGQPDELVRLYLQALERLEQEGAQPNPAVRAAVLAAAAQGVPQTDSGAAPKPPRQRQQLAGQTEQPSSGADVAKAKADALAGTAASGAKREMGHGAASSVGMTKQPASKRAAANDARWKIRALGGLAAVGLVGLLASRFLPHTAGYAELAQTLPPAPYQQQAAPRPEAFSKQAQPATQAEAHAHATPADAPASSPLPHAEQAAAAHAAKTDQLAAAAPSVRTAPANNAADDAADAPPLPVRRQATAPEPQAPAAKGKPLPRQQQQKTQQPDPQREPDGQPLAVSRRPSAWQAPQPFAQPHRAEQAEAAAATPFMRDVPAQRAITDQTAGDPLSNQMSVKRASQGAGGQAVGQAAEPFPSDAWPAAKGRSRSAASPAHGGPTAAPAWQGAPAVVASPVQPRVQGVVPLAESAQPEQSVASAASDFSSERVWMRPSSSALGQTQEMPQPTRPQRMQQARAPEATQEAAPEAVPEAMQAAVPRVAAQSKRGRFKQGQPASPTAAGQAGAAALFSAASRGDVAGVQRALQAGVAMDARDAAGRTALMHAAAHGHRSVVRHLLRHGADAGLVDHAGRDAAAYARLGGHEGLAQALSGKP